MNKHEIYELKCLRRDSKKSSVWCTWNIPDGGYAECTYCGTAQTWDGLCKLCDKRLEELELLKRSTK
jgi:hypothetical protein